MLLNMGKVKKLIIKRILIKFFTHLHWICVAVMVLYILRKFDVINTLFKNINFSKNFLLILLVKIIFSSLNSVQRLKKVPQNTDIIHINSYILCNIFVGIASFYICGTQPRVKCKWYVQNGSFPFAYTYNFNFCKKILGS